MSIEVKCFTCGEGLTEPGALVFSPPHEGGQVFKFHICTGCYEIPAHRHCEHTPERHEEMGWTCDLWPVGGSCCVGLEKAREQA